MLSLLNGFDSSLRIFFSQLTETLGFLGYLLLFLGVELLFIAIFVIKSAFSYEARLKRSLNRCNEWLFVNKKIDENNITAFNKLIKKGPKRLVYHWQQYILYREGAPSNYLTELNVIEKPLKTSSWQSNIKNLGMLTCVWAFVAAIFGLASQTASTLSLQNIAVGLVFAALVAVIGAIAIILLKGKRVLNLDDIYHLYHLFSRFLTNACADLTPFIDFDLLFTAKEIEKGNPQLREYYETRARKAKEEFENAKKNDIGPVEYHFEDVGVDGALLLNRAMKESETYITTKTKTLSQISQVEAQKDALRRNYENVQMDLQRKIQASKENIQKLIEQQAATTSRMEVGLLRQQQEKEVAKQDSLQKDYDAEEKRYVTAKAELDTEIERLSKFLDAGLEDATKGMTAEYQSFLEKIMKSAYAVAEKKVIEEKTQLSNKLAENEDELVNVQTQIKRLKDENETLRARLEAQEPNFKENLSTPEGHYDENGNFVYADGSYHDAQGLFHDVDGQVYNMNGELVSRDETPEEIEAKEKQQIIDDQINQFGAYIPVEEPVSTEEKVEETPEQEEPITTEEVKAEEVAVETPVEEAKEESTIEEAKEEPVKEDVQEEPAKKRGRPKKVVTEAAKEEPAKKRGRPRKTEINESVKKTTNDEDKKESTQRKKRGRPRKIVDKSRVVPVEPKRSPGRPRKEKPEVNTIDQINNLINEEEEKLNKLNNQLNEVLNSSNNQIDKEKEEILKAVEDLKAQAEQAKKNGLSEEELALINNRIEALIKDLSNLNK